MSEQIYQIEYKWYSGPPPYIGWWNADYAIDELSCYLWRWWNGAEWSCSAHKDLTPKQAAEWAMLPYGEPELFGILWTYYWPKNARAQRIQHLSDGTIPFI